MRVITLCMIEEANYMLVSAILSFCARHFASTIALGEMD